MYVSVDNMSKSCCFAFVLAVICLSLEADAQPTVDETMTCDSSTLEEVMNVVKVIASNQQQNAREIRGQIINEVRDVKETIASGCEEKSEDGETNETRLEEVVNMVKVIASIQQENAKEISGLKRLLESGSVEVNETRLEEVVREIRDEIESKIDLLRDKVEEVKRLLSSNTTDCECVTANPRENVTSQPSKQALVSALVCEYLLCFCFTALL